MTVKEEDVILNVVTIPETNIFFFLPSSTKKSLLFTWLVFGQAILTENSFLMWSRYPARFSPSRDEHSLFYILGCCTHTSEKKMMTCYNISYQCVYNIILYYIILHLKKIFLHKKKLKFISPGHSCYANFLMFISIMDRVFFCWALRDVRISFSDYCSPERMLCGQSNVSRGAQEKIHSCQ